jgi:hypothetical protein
MLLTWAAILFGIGALFGATMATLHFLGKTPPPVALAVLHGLFVVSGLALLLGAVWPDFGGRATIALVIFGLAALGGLTLALGRHARGKPLPSWMIVGHGSFALLAFVILLTAVFGA